jgi:hypothetical protein
MGFILGFGPRSLKESLRRATAQRLIYGVILLVLGLGLIMATTSQMFMPLFDGAGGLLYPPSLRVARFFASAGFIAAAVVLFALATETPTAEAEAATNPYSSYSYST